MNIKDAIAEIQEIEAEYGNIPLLIEVDVDAGYSLVKVDEISVENRDPYGLSALCLM